MKNWMWIIFCCSALSGHSGVITWTNVAGGNWSNPQNWNPNQVPTTNDVALITNGGTYTVVVDTNNLSVSNLTVGAGIASMGEQTLLSTNLQFNVFLQMNINGQLLVTNGGALYLSVGGIHYSGREILSASSVLVDHGGNLTCSNVLVDADMQIQNGGVLNFYYSSVGYESTGSNVTVINGGIINAVEGLEVSGNYGFGYTYAATFDGPLTVAGGGVLNVIDTVYINAPVTIDFDGVLNISSGAELGIFDSVTNAGTINLTNSEILMIGYSATFIGDPRGLFPLGAMNNLPGGLINLQGQCSIYGADYASYYGGVQTNDFFGTLTNSGVIIASGTNSIDTAVLDNSDGMITNFSGQLTLSTLPTTVSNTYIGEFYCEEGATMNLNGMPILIGAPNLRFSATPVVSNGLIFRGGGGTAWGTYVVLQSTNPTIPFSNWTPIATNAFDSQGGFVYTNVPVTGSPGDFFIFKEH